MSKTITGGVLSFAVALVGLGAVLYAADVAADGADSSATVVSDLEPILQSGLGATTWVVVLIAAISLIATVAWMLTQAAGSSGVGR
jgi:hypothetical protein